MFTPEDVVLFGFAGFIVLAGIIIAAWEYTQIVVAGFQRIFEKIIKKE
jgi:hypothetical protein